MLVCHRCQCVLILVFVLIQSISSRLRCYNGWRRYNNDCFLVVTAELSWYEAQNECRSQEGHLTSIESVTEQNFIHGRVLNQWIRDHRNIAVWIGMHADNGVWAWNNGNSSYRKWPRIAPVAVPGQCAALVASSGTWSSRDCSSRDVSGYVCMKPATESAALLPPALRMTDPPTTTSQSVTARTVTTTSKPTTTDPPTMTSQSATARTMTTMSKPRATAPPTMTSQSATARTVTTMSKPRTAAPPTMPSQSAITSQSIATNKTREPMTILSTHMIITPSSTPAVITTTLLSHATNMWTSQATKYSNSKLDKATRKSTKTNENNEMNSKTYSAQTDDSGSSIGLVVLLCAIGALVGISIIVAIVVHRCHRIRRRRRGAASLYITGIPAVSYDNYLYDAVHEKDPQDFTEMDSKRMADGTDNPDTENIYTEIV